MTTQYDTIIVGAGIAGLSCALSCDTQQNILLISENAPPKSGSTPYAQGGIAFSQPDTACIQSHIHDTMTAGAGLCDAAVVSDFIHKSYDAIQWLQSHCIHFDTTADGSLDRCIEGGHKHPRIIHIGGDATGAGITNGLFQQVQNSPHITFMIGNLSALYTDSNNTVCGVGIDGTKYLCAAVVFATGGASGLFSDRTATAQTSTAFKLAMDAGAVACDLEFFQYHPTALDISTPMRGNIPQNHGRLPLISEAVRGHGGILTVDNAPLDTGHPDGSLAPRDVVSRAVFCARQQGKTVVLDTTNIDNFTDLFPTVTRSCRQYSIDIRYIPIRPAMHYQMGGINTDVNGGTGVDGLFVIGEAAASGLHGANRLASNSLLEACIMGRNCAAYINNHALLQSPAASAAPTCIPVHADTHIALVQALNSTALGIVRYHNSLVDAIHTLRTYPQAPNVVASQMCMLFALKRTESIGAHYRKDCPETKHMPRHRMDLNTYATEIIRI